jgi:transposase-like protein
MDFPRTELMDEDACYAKLLTWLHPDGLTCPRCGARDRLHVHRRHRAPVLDSRCARCRRVFNAVTGTLLQGTRRRPAELVLFLRGIAQGVPTAQLARELDRDRSELLALRHRLQEAASANRPRMPLDDPVLEADERDQNAGEKGRPHRDPDDPPRRRANRRPGHGSWDSDRPPICGVVGRARGAVRLTVAHRADAATLRTVVRRASWPMATVDTGE